MAGTVRHLLDAIKFEHTVFALPFAYIAMVLAADGWPGGWTALWVTLAMVGGRTCAMASNRVIDRWIDARNPRTAGRHLPTGRLGVWELRALAAAGARRDSAGAERGSGQPVAAVVLTAPVGRDDAAGRSRRVRLAGGGGPARLRARACAAGRSVAPRRCVLQRQRLHRGDRAGGG